MWIESKQLLDGRCQIAPKFFFDFPLDARPSPQSKVDVAQVCREPATQIHMRRSCFQLCFLGEGVEWPKCCLIGFLYRHGACGGPRNRGCVGSASAPEGVSFEKHRDARIHVHTRFKETTHAIERPLPASSLLRDIRSFWPSALTDPTGAFATWQEMRRGRCKLDR